MHQEVQAVARKHLLTELLDTTFQEVRDATTAEALEVRMSLQRIASWAWCRRIIQFDESSSRRVTNRRMTASAFHALLERTRRKVRRERERAGGEADAKLVALHELIHRALRRLRHGTSPEMQALRDALGQLTERYFRTYRLWSSGGQLRSDERFHARAFGALLERERSKLYREDHRRDANAGDLRCHAYLLGWYAPNPPASLESHQRLLEVREHVSGEVGEPGWVALQKKAEGYRSKEIARMFGISDTSVRKRISIARMKLKAANDDVQTSDVAA